MNYLYVHLDHFFCVHEFYANNLFLRILKFFVLKKDTERERVVYRNHHHG